MKHGPWPTSLLTLVGLALAVLGLLSATAEARFWREPPTVPIDPGFVVPDSPDRN